MLMQAAKVETCSLRETYTILLLDEMHVRQDLVYDKHTGALTGFCNLGDVSDHLSKFENSLMEGIEPESPVIAKTMMVIMVRGLFNSLQFPYAQFPCCDVSGYLLYDPLWEAVGRIENCGLKVHACNSTQYYVCRQLCRFWELQWMEVQSIGA